MRQKCFIFQTDVIDIPLDLNSCALFIIHSTVWLKGSGTKDMAFRTLSTEWKIYASELPVWAIDLGRGCKQRLVKMDTLSWTRIPFEKGWKPLAVTHGTTWSPSSQVYVQSGWVINEDLHRSLMTHLHQCANRQMVMSSKSCLLFPSPVFLPGSHKTT